MPKKIWISCHKSIVVRYTDSVVRCRVIEWHNALTIPASYLSIPLLQTFWIQGLGLFYRAFFFLLNYENRRLLTFFWEKLEFWDHINLKGGWYPFEKSWSIINAIFCKYCKYYVIFDLWTFLHTFACCM